MGILLFVRLWESSLLLARKEIGKNMRYWYIIGMLLSMSIILVGEIFYLLSEDSILFKYIEILGWLCFLVLSIVRVLKSRKQK